MGTGAIDLFCLSIQTFRVTRALDSTAEHRKGITIGSGTVSVSASPFSVYLEFRNRVNFFARQHYRACIP